MIEIYPGVRILSKMIQVRVGILIESPGFAHGWAGSHIDWCIMAHNMRMTEIVCQILHYQKPIHTVFPGAE